jgi:hypothetical protein
MATTPIIPFSWDALQRTRQWEALSPQQRVWTRAFIDNGGDKLAATRLAYKCSSDRSFSCMSHEVRKHPNVVSFLELYRVLTQGMPSREEQVADLLDAIRRAPPYAQDRPRKLLAQLTGSIPERKKYTFKDADDEPEVATPQGSPTPSAAPRVFHPGQLVTHRDAAGVVHTGRVVSIDENGKPKIEGVS